MAKKIKHINLITNISLRHDLTRPRKICQVLYHAATPIKLYILTDPL